MEHYLPRPGAPQWRTATLVAAGVAAVEFAALLAIGVPMLGRAFSHEMRTAAERHVLAPVTAPSRAKKAHEVPARPRKATSIVVLNGNGLSGAASSAGRRVHALGYRVAAVGNAPRSDYARTIVMYRPGREAEAHRLAHDVRAQVVAPLDGLSVRELKGAQIALILGAR